ncbi:hypothetical protein [Streptomyces sp. NPDC006510]|uniref:hypothetical protein n=1 Tax=Streptomyces sp. NPDC006510 TaxID=3155600 RepID=UPI0033A859C5
MGSVLVQGLVVRAPDPVEALRVVAEVEVEAAVAAGVAAGVVEVVAGTAVGWVVASARAAGPRGSGRRPTW